LSIFFSYCIITNVFFNGSIVLLFVIMLLYFVTWLDLHIGAPSGWNVGHRPFFSIFLQPSSCILLSIFPLDLSSRRSSLAVLFLCDHVASTGVLVWQCCHRTFLERVQWIKSTFACDVDGAENEEDDADFDDGKKEGRRRRGGSDKDRSLPPLLARVNGQIEVRPDCLFIGLKLQSYTSTSATNESDSKTTEYEIKPFKN